MTFLSTLSLRRATRTYQQGERQENISIHALLAESDRVRQRNKFQQDHFYPRSPCGERQEKNNGHDTTSNISIHALLAESDMVWSGLYFKSLISIHALLAESDMPEEQKPLIIRQDFYPRSPCGERPLSQFVTDFVFVFLSTLSLRRATKALSVLSQYCPISIHALLAESDLPPPARCTARTQFLSTLSLRRAPRPDPSRVFR